MRIRFVFPLFATLLAIASCSRQPASPAKNDDLSAPEMTPQPPQVSTTKILTYRFDSPAPSKLSIMVTSFGGAANVTVTRDGPGGHSQQSKGLDSTTFDKLFQGTSQIPAISSTRMTEGSPTVNTETHHIIMTVERSAGASTSESYAVPEKDAPAEFREWLKLLLQSVPTR